MSIFIYHLTSEDKSVRILGFLVWKQLFETLKTKLSFQIFERSLSYWFGPKGNYKIENPTT